MRVLGLGLVLVMALAGCKTTNAFVHLKPDYTSLPVENLKTLAAEIEGIVAAGEAEFAVESVGDIRVDVPAIRQAIRTRALRHELVSALLDSGFAREEANGLIAIKRSSAYKKATTSRQRDREAMLVMSENGNRWSIYEGLVEANGWEPRSLSAVQEVFFNARVPLLTSGQEYARPE